MIRNGNRSEEGHDSDEGLWYSLTPFESLGKSV
jgi:hypothetical protein